MTTSNSSARNASSIALASRSVPMTRIRRPTGSKSSKNTDAHVSAPGGLCAPSTITSGWWATTSKRPGSDTSAKPSDTTSAESGVAKNASTAVSAIDGVVALVGAVHRHEHLGVDRRRRADVDEPAAEGQLVGRRGEVDVAQQARRRRLGGQDGDQRRVGLADHGRARRLDDAGLLAGDVGERRAGELVVVHADVGDDGDLGVDDVGGVPATEQPDLDHGDVDGDVGEPAQGRRGDRLEVARPHADQTLEIGDGVRSARRSRHRRSARSSATCAR